MRPGERLGEVDARPAASRPAPGRRSPPRRPTSAIVTPAVASASSSTGTIQRRWARAATSGTIPPVGAWRATWLATTLAWIRRPSSTSAMPVSSQLDSIASSSGPLIAAAPRRARRSGAAIGCRCRRRRQPEGAATRSRIDRLLERLRGHDQGVLVVVAVVARPDADGPEAVLLVQAARRQVRQADLERRLARPAVDGKVQQGEQQPLADPAGGDTGGSTANVVTCASSTISQIPP